MLYSTCSFFNQNDESGETDDEDDDQLSSSSSSQSFSTPQNTPQSIPKPAPRVRRISVGQPMHRPPLGEILTLQMPSTPPSPRVHPQIRSIVDGMLCNTY